MKSTRQLTLLSTLLLSFLSSYSFAYDEPIVNLGYTSFLDGGPPSGPGLYFQNYLQSYSSSRFNDNNGTPLSLPLTNLNVTADIFQFIYVTQKKFLGANIGISAVLPWVIGSGIDDGLANRALQIQSGPSSLFIGPALQYDPIMRKDKKGPRYVQRFDLDIVVPVGDYNPNIAINPGVNFWSLNPYWAETLWIIPKWTFSSRIHYLWNGTTTKPNFTFGPLVHSTQAGQAIFGNLATEFAFTEKLHIGVNGYFFSQITDTKANGKNVPKRREELWAIGPGMLYAISKNHFVFFNFYREQDAKNRPQGTSAILRYAVHF